MGILEWVINPDWLGKRYIQFQLTMVQIFRIQIQKQEQKGKRSLGGGKKTYPLSSREKDPLCPKRVEEPTVRQ